MKGLLLGLVSIVIMSMGIPDNIYDITWHKPERDGGEQFVIYKDHAGAVKAIWQDQGVYVYVEQSVIYEVSFTGDTLYFKNGIILLENHEAPVEDFALIYSAADRSFISHQGSASYKVIAERPIIYSKYGWLINLEELKADSYDKIDFQ